MQIEKGRFEANLVQFVCNDLQFAQACFNCGLDQRGASPGGVWTFAITFSPDTRMYFKGREINGNDSLMIYQPGSEIEAISKAAFGVLTFSASEDFLELLAEKNGLSGFRNQCKNSDVLLCKKHDIETLRYFLICLLFGLKNGAGRFNDSGRDAGLISLIPEVILKAIYHYKKQVPMQVSRLRDGAFRQAVACIHAHARENISVKGLVRQTGASERTLEYVFQERLGISPKKYIRVYRLNRVRKELTKSAYSIGKVADIANLWGFWHMGQFAIDYKALFRELPSDTLKTGI